MFVPTDADIKKIWCEVSIKQICKKKFFIPHIRSQEGTTYHEEEPNTHHLGRPLHAVICQSSSLNQLLGDDITDTH